MTDRPQDPMSRLKSEVAALASRHLVGQAEAQDFESVRNAMDSVKEEAARVTRELQRMTMAMKRAAAILDEFGVDLDAAGPVPEDDDE